MINEIERKYLVDPNCVDSNAGGRLIVHGYLDECEPKLSGIRVTHDMTRHKGFLTVKGERKPRGISRVEIKSEIPENDAIYLLSIINQDNRVVKKRMKTNYYGNDWYIDIYKGGNEGLIIAEIEIPDESYDYPLLPAAKIDVTYDPAFYNDYLCAVPYKQWSFNNLNKDEYRVSTSGFYLDHLFSNGAELRLLNFKGSCGIPPIDLACRLVYQDQYIIKLKEEFSGEEYVIAKENIMTRKHDFVLYHDSYGGLEHADFLKVTKEDIWSANCYGDKWTLKLNPNK